MTTPDLHEVHCTITQLAELGVPEDALQPARDWLRDRIDGRPQTAVFFGCWKDTGHFFWTPNGRHPRRADERSLSLGYPSPFGGVDGRYTPTCHTVHGAAAIHRRDGWTLLAFHDYSVDKRGNSNGAFIFDADLSFRSAVREATTFFPSVMARVGDLSLHTCGPMTPRGSRGR